MLNDNECFSDLVKNFIKTAIKSIHKTDDSNYCLFLTFKTNDGRTIIADELLDIYPTNMTIMLSNNNFSNVEFNGHGFDLDIKINEKLSSMFIDFDSIVSFSDFAASFIINLKSGVKKQTVARQQMINNCKIIDLKLFR